MKTIEYTIEINRQPEAVFDFMLSPEHAPEWRDLVTKMEWIDDGPRVGARLRLVFWSEGKEHTQELTLVEYDRPRRYAFENHNNGYRGFTSNEIVATASGSRVTSSVGARGDTIWASLLLPILRKRHRERLPATMARLKAAAEKAG